MGRASNAIKDMMNKDIKIGKIMIRATPVMEILLGLLLQLSYMYQDFLLQLVK